MSYKLMGEAVEADHKSLDTKARIVLIVLANFAHESTRQCWPSNATIASMTSLSIASIGYAINDLVDKGYITTKLVKMRRFVYINPMSSWPLNLPGDGIGLPAGGIHMPGDGRTLPAGGTEPVKNQLLNQEKEPGADFVVPTEGDTVGTCWDQDHWTNGSLADHFLIDVVPEMYQYGLRRVGSFKKIAFTSRLKAIAKDFDLDLDEIHGLMHLFAKSTSTWDHGRHPAAVFVTNATIVRLRNMQAPLDVVPDQHHEPVGIAAKRHAARLEQETLSVGQ